MHIRTHAPRHPRTYAHTQTLGVRQSLTHALFSFDLVNAEQQSSHRPERLVGVMHQQITLPDDGKDGLGVLGLTFLGQTGGNHRLPRLVAQLGQVQVGDLEAAGQI